MAEEGERQNDRQPGGPAAGGEQPGAAPGAGSLKEEGVRRLKDRLAALTASGTGAAAQRAAWVSVGKRDRFDRFTDRAKKVLVLAEEEAQRFNHNYIGTEHLLLGLVAEKDGIGARTLTDMGIELDQVRASVEFIIGRGDRVVKGPRSLTPRSKKVIELAVEEARTLNHAYVGTEHLLLGLIREGEGIAAGVLESLGVTLAEVPARVLRVLEATTTFETPPPMPTKDNVLTCRVDDTDLAAIDMLVEAGIRSTRSDAAQWLIHAGIAANKALFDKVSGTVAEIRRLRDEARQAAWHASGDAAALLNTTPAEPPGREAKPDAEQPAGGKPTAGQPGSGEPATGKPSGDLPAA